MTNYDIQIKNLWARIDACRDKIWRCEMIIDQANLEWDMYADQIWNLLQERENLRKERENLRNERGESPAGTGKSQKGAFR